jgi:hypothetical protein
MLEIKVVNSFKDFRDLKRKSKVVFQKKFFKEDKVYDLFVQLSNIKLPIIDNQEFNSIDFQYDILIDIDPLLYEDMKNTIVKKLKKLKEREDLKVIVVTRYNCVKELIENSMKELENQKGEKDEKNEGN